MSVKKYGNLTQAQIAKRISVIKDKNKTLQITISDNARDLKILETRLGETQEIEKYGFIVPKSFRGWEIGRTGNSFVFGCGAVIVNRTQLKSFLAIEDAFSKHFTKSTTLYIAHLQAFEYAQRVMSYGNEAGVGTIGVYPIRNDGIGHNWKWVIGCGEVTVSKEEIKQFYRVYSNLGNMENCARYIKSRKETIELARKLLKMLS